MNILAILIPPFFVILQTVLQPFIVINGIYPELTLISLMYYGNSRNQLCGQFSGLFTGIAIDFLSLAPLGFFAFIYTLMGFLVGVTRKKVYANSILTTLLLTIIAFAFKGVVAFILAGVFKLAELQASIFGIHFLFQALYTLALVPIVFAFLRFIDKAIPQRQQKGYQH